MKCAVGLVWLTIFCRTILPGQDKAIDAQRSTITVHVGKAGLLSVAGHEHWVNAPISSGTLNDTDAPRVEFIVKAAEMAVKADPKVDAKTQAEIQKSMQEKVLDSAAFPDITFRSTRVEKVAGGQWSVDGLLKLHGVARPVTVTVKPVGGAYTGAVILKQTDYGIKPVSAAGGAVKVKNELEVEFKIFARE